MLMDPTSVADGPSQSYLGDNIFIVFAAYLLVFVPWTIFQSIDFINEEWKTVHDTRKDGINQLIFTAVPAVIVIVYIILQIGPEEYKEMAVAFVALLFSIHHFLKTVWGLWQLHEFRIWAERSIRVLESHGISYDLGRLVKPCSTQEDNPCRWKAKHVMVNSSVIDNQVLKGNTICFLARGKSKKLFLPPREHRYWYSWFSFILDGFHVCCEQILRFSFFCMKLIPAFCRGSTTSSPYFKGSLRQVPYAPIDVWIRWAVPFASQGMKAWIDQFNVPSTPDPGDGVSSAAYQQHRDYYASEVLASAILLLPEKRQKDLSKAHSFGKGHPLQWDCIRRPDTKDRFCTESSSLYSTDESYDYVNLLPQEALSVHLGQGMDDDSKTLTSFCKVGKFSKMELLRGALTSGKGLPFDTSHIYRENVDMRDFHWSMRVRLCVMNLFWKGNVDGMSKGDNKGSKKRGYAPEIRQRNEIVEEEVWSEGYKPFSHKLQKVTSSMPDMFGSTIEKFDVEHLEWLAILLSLGENIKEGAVECEDESSVADSFMDMEEHEIACNIDDNDITDEDIPIQMLNFQLGFKKNIKMVGKSKILRNACNSFYLKNTTFPIVKFNVGDRLWGNRNVLQVSGMIDNWKALRTGDYMKRLLVYDKRWSTVCLQQPGSTGKSFDQPMSELGGSRLFQQHIEIEKQALLMTPLVEGKDLGLDQSITFMGFVMENVRSHLASQGLEGIDYRPKIPFKYKGQNPGLLTDVILSFNLSNALSCALHNNQRGVDMHNRTLQMRFIMELQGRCDEVIRGEGVSSSNNHITLSMVMNCILAFPSLYMFNPSKLSWGNRVIQAPADCQVQFGTLYSTSIHAVCGPQRLYIIVQLMKEKMNVKVEAKLARKYVESDCCFEWEAWRDAFNGRLEGARQWKEKHGLPNEKIWFRHVPIKKTGMMRLVDDDKPLFDDSSDENIIIMNKEFLTVWGGWLPARPLICEFELRSPHLILQYSSRTSGRRKQGEEVISWPFIVHYNETLPETLTSIAIKFEMHLLKWLEKQCSSESKSTVGESSLSSFSLDDHKYMGSVPKWQNEDKVEEMMVLLEEASCGGNIPKVLRLMKRLNYICHTRHGQAAVRMLKKKYHHVMVNTKWHSDVVLAYSWFIRKMSRSRELPSLMSVLQTCFIYTKRIDILEEMVIVMDEYVSERLTDVHIDIFLGNILKATYSAWMCHYLCTSIGMVARRGITLHIFGSYYKHGRYGIKPCVEKAVEFYGKAVMNNNSKAAEALQQIAQRRDCERKVKHRVLEFLKYAQILGNTSAYYARGHILEGEVADIELVWRGVVRCFVKEFGGGREEAKIALTRIVEDVNRVSKYTRLEALDGLTICERKDVKYKAYDELIDRHKVMNILANIHNLEPQIESNRKKDKALEMYENETMKSSSISADEKVFPRDMQCWNYILNKMKNSVWEFFDCIIEKINGKNKVCSHVGSFLEEEARKAKDIWTEVIVCYVHALRDGTRETSSAVKRIVQNERGLSKEIRLIVWRELKEAAQRGCKYAAFEVGSMIEVGTDLENADMKESIKFFGKAAREGHEEALKKLKDFVLEKETRFVNMGNNPFKALRQIANSGNQIALFLMGCITESSMNNRDLDSSVQWYGKAAASGRLTYGEQSVEKLKGIAEHANKKEVFEELRKAAASGNEYAAYEVGIMLEKENEDTVKVKEEIIDQYGKAAQFGHKQALETLIKIAKEENPSNADLRKRAISKWPAIAKYKGFSSAERLRKCQDHNANEEIEWNGHLACEEEYYDHPDEDECNEHPVHRLLQMSRNPGPREDRENAMKQLIRAVDSGNKYAAYTVGSIRETSEDIEEAIYYYGRAAKEMSEEAVEKLIQILKRVTRSRTSSAIMDQLRIAVEHCNEHALHKINNIVENGEFDETLSFKEALSLYSSLANGLMFEKEGVEGLMLLYEQQSGCGNNQSMKQVKDELVKLSESKGGHAAEKLLDLIPEENQENIVNRFERVRLNALLLKDKTFEEESAKRLFKIVTECDNNTIKEKARKELKTAAYQGRVHAMYFYARTLTEKEGMEIEQIQLWADLACNNDQTYLKNATRALVGIASAGELHEAIKDEAKEKLCRAEKEMEDEYVIEKIVEKFEKDKEKKDGLVDKWEKVSARFQEALKEEEDKVLAENIVSSPSIRFNAAVSYATDCPNIM